MGNNYFNFKQFCIRQERSAMRVNTDGVLLGAWVDVNNLAPEDHILDIGTGTGIIALMMAQRTDCQVDAVEIDAPSAEEARQNCANSSWNSRLSVYCIDIQNFTPEYQYKLIISNPPYFLNSLAAPDPSRTTARHANDLTYSDLVDAAVRLLTPNGCLALILPVGEETELLQTIANKKSLYLQRITEVSPLPKSQKKRALIELSRNKNNWPQTDTLIIQIKNSYTPEYKKLTSEFYINF